MQLEFFDTAPKTEVQESEFRRLLGYPPDHILNDRARELATWAREWFANHGNPWVYARLVPLTEKKDGTIRIGQRVLTPGRLYERLIQAEAENVMLVAVSAGPACEEHARLLWNEGKPDEYFFLEMFGSAVVEHLVASASFRLCSWADEAGVAVLPHYSPGYPEWDIRDQTALWEIMNSGGNWKIGERLEVMETGMLKPKKSLLALFGVTRHLDSLPRLTDLIPCENCSLPACQYRRAPQRYPLPRLEEIRSLQPATVREPPKTARQRTDGRYSINPAALRKWSKERLTLNALPDRGVDAHFRYDGTTCSNLGRPLAFDFRVRLAPSDSGFIVVNGSCTPAVGDSGHKHMCEYIKAGLPLIEEINAEQPLKGKLLSDVFSWKRPYNPSACFCAPDSRQHKWGIVFEVLHYALEGSGQSNSIAGAPTDAIPTDRP